MKTVFITFRWTYSSQNELGAHSYYGDVSTYGGGGYYVDLTVDTVAGAQIIKDLKDNLWFDRGTRAVFTDFTTYNGNVNLFCSLK